MYFRITGYEPKNDISFILDCNGMFEKLWQFSAFVISKGCKVLEVSNSNNFIDITLTKAEYDAEHIFLRAIHNSWLDVHYKSNWQHLLVCHFLIDQKFQ